MPLPSACSWIASAALLFATAAHALMVHEGKIVSAWPDDPAGTAPLPSRGSLGKAAAAPINLYPHPAGEVWGLTLLVDFSDQASAITKPEIDEWLNLKGFNRYGCNGSVRDYFGDVSNGKVDFRNEIHGFYRAKNPKSYYEGGEGYARAAELLNEMLQNFDAEVDFSKFDNDKDGKVDAISIVYAGKGLTWGKGLWPHAGSLNQTRDGKQLTRYMMTDLGQSLSLYVFCHEIGHMLFGWPDLYGFGDYCLMGDRIQDANPVTINDCYRADQGWIETVDIAKADNAFHKSAANSSIGFRYVNPARPQESFFWSNLKNTGRRTGLKGRGLLILHFDKAIGRNEVTAKSLSLAVVQADGKKQLDTTNWPEPGSDALDYFSAATGAKFGAASAPASKWNDGSASGLEIYGIGAAADTMGFYVGTGLVGLAPSRPMSGAQAGGGEVGTGSQPETFDTRGKRIPNRIKRPSAVTFPRKRIQVKIP